MNVPTFAVGDALLLVDPQNDFCPGGSLPVTDGDRVMPVLSAWAAAAHAANAPVFISRDWHPPDTTHFATHGGVWPPHCVQGTPGAEFHADLEVPPSAVVVSKGMGSTEDAYSAFQARDDRGRLLTDLLRARRVTHLYVMGLATDYCVEASALGGLDAGLRVSVVRPGCRAVDIRPDDGTLAFQRMQAAGAQLIA